MIKKYILTKYQTQAMIFATVLGQYQKTGVSPKITFIRGIYD